MNSKALKLAGITKRTPNPAQGVIVKDPRTGEPTGVLKEAAIQLVGKHVPAVDREPIASSALRDALGEAHRFGITSVQNHRRTVDESRSVRRSQEGRRPQPAGLLGAGRRPAGGRASS